MRSIVTPRTVSTTAQQIGTHLAAEERRDAREQAVMEDRAVLAPTTIQERLRSTAGNLDFHLLYASSVTYTAAQVQAEARLLDAAADTIASVLASLREMVGLYDGMDARDLWSKEVRAKVLRARAVLAEVDKRV